MIAPASSAACCTRQRRRRHAEVVARRRLGAPDAVAPLDHVQIDLEDARLRQRRLEPPRDDQLAQLAQRVARRRQVEVLGELLRDRAGAARRLALSRCSSGSTSRISLDVDAFVLARTRCPRPPAPRASGSARCASTAPSAGRTRHRPCRRARLPRARSSMNAVVFGLAVASGRTSGSVRYT